MIAIVTPPIEVVIQRLAADKAFRMKYSQDPDGTLEAYLSPEEIKAVKTGDGHQLLVLLDGRQWEALNAALCGDSAATD